MKIGINENSCDDSSELNNSFNNCIEFIETAREGGFKVLVHCRMGVNRSGVVVSAYLMRVNRWGLDQALGYVSRRRGRVSPDFYLVIVLENWEKRELG
jgi:protein-tyrosine phosphatase